MKSLWEECGARVSFDALTENRRTDVLVIGGGMAGLLCLHRLHHDGVDCMLVEADRICSGVTADTTAKITLQHGLLYDKLIRRMGLEQARLYLEAQRMAGRRYAELCRDISCGYEKKDSYVYSLRDRRRLEKEVRAFNRLGEAAEFRASCELPFPISGAVCVKDQAQFHPLQFAFGLAKQLPIYEQTKVLAFRPNRVLTNHGEIFCHKIIVATHFPLWNRHGGYWLKMYQHRSYVLALENAQTVNGMYVDESNRGMSFRQAEGKLLLGGGGHRTGKKGGNWRELEAFARIHYPQASITYRFATQDCMTLDGVPYIGRYAMGTPHVYVATGFNKWGMTSAMIAAELLSDLVQGRQNDYAELFSPSRSILHPQLALNLWESVIGLLTPTLPRCPHLGCALKYNPHEHSWDCPCHGSRFTESGKLIHSPATDDHKRLR